MTYLAIGLAVVVFALALRQLKVVAAVTEALDTGRRAAGVMAAADLDEDQKEVAVRRAALDLFRSFGVITLRTAIAVAGSLLVVLAAAWAGLVALDEVARTSISWEVIIVSAVVMTVVMVVRR
jgi:hypothetical protein